MEGRERETEMMKEEEEGKERAEEGGEVDNKAKRNKKRKNRDFSLTTET